MTADDLAKHIATLPALPCGCTVNHVGRCLDALALWKVVTDGWGKLPRDKYFAATKEYLAHFENSAPAPEPVAEPAQMGLGLGMEVGV